jgi:ubiquinone/menaquinone biosynthesis C-methylase UbiE
MDIFIRASTPLLRYAPEDVVLDIGAGPGYLAVHLKDRVKEIHCLEASEKYLRVGRDRLRNEKNVFFHLLRADYTDLSFLQDRKFTIVICKSVIQYYRSVDEVDALIENVRKIAAPGCRFLIADIPGNAGWLSDIWGVLRGGYRAGFLKESLFFFLRARMSEYYRLRSSAGLLTLSRQQLEQLISRLALRADILDLPLTYVENRKHLLIRY